MKKTEGFVARYQLPIFFFLTYLLSWWSVPFANGGLLPHGPAFAALIILALTAGRQGMSQLWRRMTHWGAGWWYLIGPAVIVGYQGIAFIINLLLGATIAEAPHLPTLATFLFLLFMGGQWEELGWTGYALPKIQERFASRTNGALLAALVLGVFRSLWHLPLFLYGAIYWFDIFIFAFAFQLIIAWLYTRSGGSVPVVFWFHFMSNILGSVMSSVFAEPTRTTYYILFMGLAALFAAVIAWNSPSTLERKEPGRIQNNIA